MSQYDITHTCGHSRTIDITGTNVRGEREQRAERERASLCPDCTRQRATEIAVARAAEAGLPELTEGTPKQLGWAERLRRSALDELDVLRAQIAQWAAQDPSRRDDAARFDAALDTAVRAHGDAPWWIDNRDHLRRTLHSEALDILHALPGQADPTHQTAPETDS